MKHRHSMPFGAELDAEGGARFRLWAPSAEKVDLVLQSPARTSAIRTLNHLDGGWYELRLPEIPAGTRYHYRIDDELEVPDPAARFNPEGVRGPSEVVDPSAFDWQNDRWRGRPWREAVVYELHVGTFTSEGTYAAIIPRLQELAELGITAIELMPIACFGGARGWGYDGVLPFAPHPIYGRPEDLKRLVQAAHACGLMMLLDVVYNHFGPEGNYLHRYADDFFTARHRTPWGRAINFEGESGRNVRQFFLHNARYWIDEYRFDGLRIDAVHAILDDSKPDFIAELTEIVAEDRERYVHMVLENHHNEARRLFRGSPIGPPNLGCVSQWNDDFHHPLHVLLTGETDGYYEDFATQPLAQLGRALAEGFVFQGEASAYAGNRPRGEPSAHLSPTAFVDFLQTHDQVGNRAFGERLAMLASNEALRAAMTILLLSPHIPMLFMGEEYAATQPFLYFCNFTGDLAAAVTQGRRKEFERFRVFANSLTLEQIPDPNAESTFTASQLDWTERQRGIHGEWLAYVGKLLKIRAQHVVPTIPELTGVHTWRIEKQVLSVEWRTAQDATLQMLANLAGSRAPPIAAEHGTPVFYTTGEDALATAELGPWEVRFFKTGPALVT